MTEKLQPHPFEGILQGIADRDCTRCGLPDRNPIHQPRPVPPEILEFHPKMVAFYDAAARLIAAKRDEPKYGVQYVLIRRETFEALEQSFAAIAPKKPATEVIESTEGKV